MLQLLNVSQKQQYFDSCRVYNFNRPPNIIQSQRYQSMDYSKDLNIKRRCNGSNPQFSSKNIANLNQQPTTPRHNKGKVRIEQYQYDQQNILGEGFTSKVYLGRKIEDLKNHYAIKVIDKRKLSKTKQNIQLLKQQMYIHKQLDHPNIIKCYDIIEKNNFYYFVLEYCPHGTLDSFIKKHQKLMESTAIGIMEQISAGYKYLIKQKVLHRDLKPPNILKSGPNWKICDFGFSVMGKKNLVGEINVGTPAYMAPEALQRTFYSTKTDIFSLGVLCYEMLFGSTPWQHKNEKILLQLIKQTKLKQEVLQAIKNNNLAMFIKKCCESNERKRMTQQQFQNFSFWKETANEEIEQMQPLGQKNKLRKNLLSKVLGNMPTFEEDHPSTCGSKTSKASNNTSAIKIQRKISIEELFQGNTAVLQREMYYATVIFILLKNNNYLLFEEAEEKELFMCLLNKHLGYIVRRIRHTKVNYLCLKKWQEYFLNQAFISISDQSTIMQNKAQQLVTAQIKRRSIITIRYVNGKFDDLTYDKHLSLTCVNNLRNYLLEVMKRLVKRYEMIGQKYINENKWTTKVLDYLMIYFKYLGEVTATTEQSRSLAIKKEFKNRSQLEQDFGKSSMSLQQFQCLKYQIEAICI